MTAKQNYLARMELNKQNRLACGLLSARFPEVSGIVINMTYYQKGADSVIMQRTLNVFPTDFAYFKMECILKDCGDGGFDLSSVINNMIKNRKKAGKGKLVCCGKNSGLAPEHASISYEIAIQYNRQSR